jgi:hypothetical protein
VSSRISESRQSRASNTQAWKHGLVCLGNVFAVKLREQKVSFMNLLSIRADAVYQFVQVCESLEQWVQGRLLAEAMNALFSSKQIFIKTTELTIRFELTLTNFFARHSSRLKAAGFHFMMAGLAKAKQQREKVFMGLQKLTHTFNHKWQCYKMEFSNNLSRRKDQWKRLTMAFEMLY